MGETGMAKHNERRRNNRAIKKNVIAWAKREGWWNDSELARLEDAPPKEAKEWARDRGVDPEKFIDGIPDQAIPNNPHDNAPAAPSLPQLPAVPPPAGGGAGRHRASGAAAVGALAVRGGRAAPPPGRPPVAPTPVAPTPGGAWSTQHWCTEELHNQINAAMAQQGTHRDERALLDGKSEKAVTLARSHSTSGSYIAGTSSAPRGGTNTTRRIELDNGVTGYFKPFDGVNEDLATGFGQDSSQQSLHEAAAWQLAREMGPPWSEVVPPVVIRELNGEMGSFALARPGKNMVDFRNTGEWRESAFFDSLIGQQDRHPGNYLVSGDRIALIDHGYTFARPGDYRNHSWLTRHRSTEDPSLSYDERQVLRRLVASPNLLGLRSVLQPARADALKARAERMLNTGTITTDY